MSDDEGNVHTLPGVVPPISCRPDRCEAIVDALRALLAEAEGGNVRGLGFVAVSRHGMLRWNWEGDSERFRLGHGIARLHHEYFAACATQDTEKG